MQTRPTGPRVHTLVIDSENAIEVDVFASDTLAKDALMRDLYESFQDYPDLPDEYDEGAISAFIGNNGLSYSWTLSVAKVIEPVSSTPEKEIRWGDTHGPIYGRGRNGDFLTTGIEVMGSADMSSLYLSNFTSKGKVANGWTAVPNDPETIRKLATSLLCIADEVEKNNASV